MHYYYPHFMYEETYSRPEHLITYWLTIGRMEHTVRVQYQAHSVPKVFNPCPCLCHESLSLL